MSSPNIQDDNFNEAVAGQVAAYAKLFEAQLEVTHSWPEKFHFPEPSNDIERTAMSCFYLRGRAKDENAGSDRPFRLEQAAPDLCVGLAMMAHASRESIPLAISEIHSLQMEVIAVLQ